MPNFKKNPSQFIMKNPTLSNSVKHGSPMQANYGKPSPAKALPIIAKIGALVAKAGTAVKAAGGIKAAAKAGVKSAGKAIVKGGKKVAAKAAEEYAKGGMFKTAVDSTASGAVNKMMSPKEKTDEQPLSGGNQIKIM